MNYSEDDMMLFLRGKAAPYRRGDDFKIIRHMALNPCIERFNTDPRRLNDWGSIIVAPGLLIYQICHQENEYFISHNGVNGRMHLEGYRFLLELFDENDLIEMNINFAAFRRRLPIHWYPLQIREYLDSL